MLCHHGSTMMSSEALLQTRLARFDVLFLWQRIAGTAQNRLHQATSEYFRSGEAATS